MTFVYAVVASQYKTQQIKTKRNLRWVQPNFVLFAIIDPGLLLFIQ